MNPDDIKEMVHKEYPEFRKTFKVADTEEILKI